MMVAGVPGLVRLRGGVEIEREIMRQAPLTLGTSVATTSGDLSACGVTLILHAVVFDDLGGTTRIDNVQRALGSALQSADRHRVRSILIPPVGSGVSAGRMTQHDVYEAIIGELAAHLRRFTSRIEHITIACPNPKDLRTVFGLVQQAHTLWWQLKTSSWPE